MEIQSLHLGTYKNMNTINPTLEISRQSRLFNEPPPPKPTSVVHDLADAIEIANSLTGELRRLENRLVLIQAKLANLQTIQRP